MPDTQATPSERTPHIASTDLPQRHLNTRMFISVALTAATCPSKTMDKGMWCVDTMDVYLDVKKTKWINVVTRLRQIIQSKKKNKHRIFFHISNLGDKRKWHKNKSVKGVM